MYNSTTYLRPLLISLLLYDTRLLCHIRILRELSQCLNIQVNRLVTYSYKGEQWANFTLM